LTTLINICFVCGKINIIDGGTFLSLPFAASMHVRVQNDFGAVAVSGNFLIQFVAYAFLVDPSSLS